MGKEAKKSNDFSPYFVFFRTFTPFFAACFFACKVNPEAISTPKAASPQPAIAQDRPLGLASESSSPFYGSERDLYQMSKADLQRVPPSDLMSEIAVLTVRNKAEIAELTQIKAFNLLMCQRLQKLQKDCVAELYITQDHGLDALNCEGQDDAQALAKADIRVALSGALNKSYILIADSVYVSNEFVAGSSSPIRFQRKDNKVVKPPRFRDLSALQIVAVKAGTAAIVDGNLAFIKDSMPPLKGFGIKISVNGKALLGDTPLVLPDDPLDDWYFRIAPQGIMNLGRSPACTVSLEDLRQLQAQATTFTNTQP